MAVEETYHNSRVIEKTEYDSDNKTLIIEFKNGTEYKYYNVEESVHEGLLSASSVGSYFISHIKESYMFNKI